MTNIEQKAIELVNDARRRNFLPVLSAETISGSVSFPALRYAIEDHERFRQEVSKAIVDFVNQLGPDDDTFRQAMEYLDGFIISKPDPLVEAMAECGVDPFESWADQLRAALAKRGLEIREKEA